MIRSLSLAALLVLPALTRAADEAKTDEQFVMMASSGGMFEVQSSEMALKQSSSDAVKKFAKHMVEDHTKANKELMDLASKKKFRVAERMMKPHADMATRLASAKGDNFDAAYIKMQVDAHEDTVKLFEDQAKNGKDSDLKAWAEKTLPTLKDHLKMARDMAKSGKDR